MSDLKIWKHSKSGQIVQNEIQKEIEIVKERILGGNLLVFDVSEHLSREYAKLMGYIDGLKYLQVVIDNIESEDIDD